MPGDALGMDEAVKVDDKVAAVVVVVKQGPTVG